MKSNAKTWKNIYLIIGIVLGSVVLSTAAFAQTVQRPIGDFLSAQGQPCDAGAPACTLFVPPDRNFLGWNSEFDVLPVRFAGVDYAGLTEPGTYPSGNLPQITGTVIERTLEDGRAEVRVLLHTKNANVWVIKLDLNGDVLDQIAHNPTLFGHRPSEVRNGASQALGDSFLNIVFINSAPGALLPDLVTIMNETPDLLKFVSFSTNASGPLNDEFGVTQGTPGKCTITQTGLFMTNGRGVALEDSFPVEAIDLRVVGH